MKIYLARPISGCTPKEVQNYYEMMITHDNLKQYYKFTPIVETEVIRCETVYKQSGYTGINSDHAIYMRDRWFATHCDIFHVNLLKCPTRSLGCTSELTMAKMSNAHTIVVMERDNCHRHPFITEAADIVFETLQESLDYLKTFWKGE